MGPDVLKQAEIFSAVVHSRLNNIKLLLQLVKIVHIKGKDIPVTGHGGP
jgi:hypothetical protein